MIENDRGDAVTKGFLTAEWRHIAILNFPSNPSLLTPLLAEDLELDLWDGQAFLSVVGLRFERPSVWRIRLPFYRRFEQVNLRYYVRRRVGCGWRPGVVFVKEFVPYRSMAAAAHLLYSQDYEFARMRCRVDSENRSEGGQARGCLPDEPHGSNTEFGVQPSGRFPDERPSSTSVEYLWLHSGRWNRLGVRARGPSKIAARGSFEEFITERRWGYAGVKGGGCIEFELRRPAWLVSPADGWLDCDTVKLYGGPFAGILSCKPASAMLAAGSAVTLGRGVRLAFTTRHRRSHRS